MIHYLVALLLYTGITNSSMIPFPEDAYLMQAPQEIVDNVQHVAQLMGFEDQYYVIAPKKPALEINPWNEFIAHGLHPENKTPLIIINPEWFNALPQDQQAFLLGRCFVGFQEGITPQSISLFPLLWTMFLIMLATLMIFGIKKTRLGQQRLWTRLLIAWVALVVCNLTFLNAVQQKISQYLLRKHDHYIHARVIEKTGNKEAAINALEHYHESVTSEALKGDPFWKPFEGLFADYAQRIKETE